MIVEEREAIHVLELVRKEYWKETWYPDEELGREKRELVADAGAMAKCLCGERFMDEEAAFAHLEQPGALFPDIEGTPGSLFAEYGEGVEEVEVQVFRADNPIDTCLGAISMLVDLSGWTVTDLLGYVQEELEREQEYDFVSEYDTVCYSVKPLEDCRDPFHDLTGKLEGGTWMVRLPQEAVLEDWSPRDRYLVVTISEYADLEWLDPELK